MAALLIFYRKTTASTFLTGRERLCNGVHQESRTIAQRRIDVNYTSRFVEFEGH